MFKLTLGEIAAVEDLSGIAIDDIQSAGVPKGKALAAVVMVVKKRTNPEFTFKDALAMDMDEAMLIVNPDGEDFDDEDPKEQN